MAVMQQLVDAHIFREADRVLEGLKNHDCSEALAWCNDNKSKLKKIRSKLEFRLHLQVFIEHVRRSELMEAISYAKMHLAPLASQNMEAFQHAIATLAFK